jgi:hypothetical protein
MIRIDMINMPLMRHYKNTTIQLCYDYNTITYNLIRIHINYLCFHHMGFILNDLKCYGTNTSSSRNHLQNGKENEFNQKITREISFPIYKTFFLETPLTFKTS